MAKTRGLRLGSDTHRHLQRVFAAQLESVRDFVPSENNTTNWSPVRVRGTALDDNRFEVHEFDHPDMLRTWLSWKPQKIHTESLHWYVQGFSVRFGSCIARHTDIDSMAHARFHVQFKPTNRRTDGSTMKFHITARLPEIAVLRAELGLPYGANVHVRMFGLGSGHANMPCDRRPRDTFHCYLAEG
jgi:hypothetical protein